MRRLRKFIGLPRVERGLLLRALLTLWALRFALRVLPFRTVNAYVKRRSGTLSRSSGRVSLDCLVWIMAAAGSLFPGQRTCLVRALAGSLLVSGEGYAPTLRLGVARDGENRLEAHAWLECDGRVLVGDVGLDRYTAFPLPSRLQGSNVSEETNILGTRSVGQERMIRQKNDSGTSTGG